MSSLFDKLKTLVTARVLGPAAPIASEEAEAESEPVPEVTDASGYHQDVPEVTEASPAEIAALDQTDDLPERDTALSSPERIDKTDSNSPEDKAQPGTLEDARVADLLKGKQS